VRGFTVVPEDMKPVTLSSPGHPLSRIFGNGTETATQPQGLDSVAQAKIQMEKDKTMEKQEAWRPVRKTQRYADTSTSYDIEKMLRNGLGINASPIRLDALSAEWRSEDLVKVTQFVIESAKGRPCSCDGILYAIESSLSEAAA
jgi:hypothetical protein